MAFFADLLDPPKGMRAPSITARKYGCHENRQLYPPLFPDEEFDFADCASYLRSLALEASGLPAPISAIQALGEAPAEWAALLSFGGPGDEGCSLLNVSIECIKNAKLLPDGGLAIPCSREAKDWEPIELWESTPMILDFLMDFGRQPLTSADYAAPFLRLLP